MKHKHSSLDKSELYKLGEDYKEISQKEFSELPKGSKVIILWSEGNGPHEYNICKSPDGENITQEWNPNAGWFNGQVSKSDTIWLKLRQQQ